MREKWSSRSTFIMAAIGSAVGLGNAWRFPGLAAKHGGGAFLFVYLLAMLAVGIPMLMMEIAIGRRVRQGAPGAMRAVNKKAEPIGWIAVSNGFFICIYYAAVFAWVILMFFNSYRFAPLTGDSASASKLWMNLIQTTGTTSGYTTISWAVLGCLLIAWVALALPCPIRFLTGIPCPGCGMSRAWLAVLQLDIAAAFSYHPMFWVLPVLALFILYDCAVFRRMRTNYLILGLLLLGVLVCYALRLPGFLDGSIPI